MSQAEALQAAVVALQSATAALQAASQPVQPIVASAAPAPAPDGTTMVVKDAPVTPAQEPTTPY